MSFGSSFQNINNNMFSPMLSLTKIYPKERIEYINTKPNILVSFLKKYPNEHWNFEDLSENPNITWDVVRMTINKRWNWKKLCTNNPHITIDVLRTFINYIDWRALSKNPYITWELIEEFPDKDWHWIELCFNNCVKMVESTVHTDVRNINLSIKNLDKLSRFNDKLFYNVLSQNPTLTFDIVKSSLNKNWDWQQLSLHKNLTNSFVEKNIDLPWDWEWMSTNSNIDLVRLHKKFPHLIHERIVTNPKNPNISTEILEKEIQRQLHLRDSQNLKDSLGHKIYIHIFQLLSQNEFLYNDNVYEKTKNKDNIINTILVLETIDSQKMTNRAENIKCKSSLCDYNIINIIKDMLI